jgi:hypothetical protein
MPSTHLYALSKAAKVNIDPKRESDRDEWGVVLHVMTLFPLRACMHAPRHAQTPKPT